MYLPRGNLPFTVWMSVANSDKGANEERPKPMLHHSEIELDNQLRQQSMHYSCTTHQGNCSSSTTRRSAIETSQEDVSLCRRVNLYMNEFIIDDEYLQQI